MWPFTSKKTFESSGCLSGWTDWHCHILPGVDDGVRNMDQSLRILEQYSAWGIKEVWLTPHIMEDVPNETSHLQEVFKQLEAACKSPVKLHLAAENMMDNLFEERLAKGDLLPLQDNYLLVETSYFFPPLDFWELLERIKSQGYTPLLAHPERYVYMGMKEYKRLREMSVPLQLNIMSLAGLYGEDAQNKAKKLLDLGMYQRCGSDLHRLTPLQKVITEKKFSKDFFTQIMPVFRYEE